MAKQSLLFLVLVLTLGLPSPGAAQLRYDYYASACPNVENIVRNAVAAKFRQTFVTVPGTVRLFFHDCIVQVLLQFFSLLYMVWFDLCMWKRCLRVVMHL